MELDKEYYSRSAGLNRRLAAAEKDEWDDLVERAHWKQQEEEDKQKECPKQLEDKEQAYL